MPNDLDQATAAALKRRDHQRADPASNSPEPDAQGSGTYDNRTHSSSFRQIKKKAVQFKCGRLLANYRDLWLQLRSRIERHAKLRSFHTRCTWCWLQRLSDLFNVDFLLC